MQNNDKKNSDAKIRANNKYNQKAYKQLAIRLKPADYDYIVKSAKQLAVSQPTLIYKAVKYIIDNNIDINDIDN